MSRTSCASVSGRVTDLLTLLLTRRYTTSAWIAWLAAVIGILYGGTWGWLDSRDRKFQPTA